MATQPDATTPARGELFRSLHVPGRPLLLPNPWDRGSARLLAGLGFRALATTSSGHATTLGRIDGAVTRDEALANAEMIVGATDLPVSADLENGFADEPSGVAECVELAAATGLAGCSIEDYTGDPAQPIYPLELAAARIAAAAQVAHGSRSMVLTARAENLLHGRPDLADTIERLQRVRAGGGGRALRPGPDRSRRHPPGRRLGRAAGERAGAAGRADRARARRRRCGAGVGGGAFAYTAMGAVVEAARELLDHGTYGFWDRAARGRAEVRAAFGA